MLPTPKKYTMVCGSAEGPTELNAFDNALLQSGIGNLNLLRVSSVLPPTCTEAERLDVAPGSLTPTAYGTITSDVPGQTIAAAVAIGFSRDSYGIIMEYSGVCSREEAEQEVAKMARSAFEQREIALANLKVRSTEHRVDSIGCAFAAVALWY